MEIRKTSLTSTSVVQKKVSTEKPGKDILDVKDSISLGTESVNDETSFLKSMRDVARQEAQDAVQQNKNTYTRHLVSDCVYKGALGGAIGFVLLEKCLGPVGSVAAGAAAGAFLAWDKLHNQEKGKVTINIDGKISEKPYYINPAYYEKSPEEEEMIEKSHGKISYNIPPLKLNAEEMESESSPRLKPYAENLKSLGKDRRLLASFGKKSSDGRAALHLIDSNMAKNLIASGKPVFVLSVTDLKDIPHSYSTEAINKNGTVYDAKAFDFLERKIDYSLSEIKNPEELGNIKEGKGLPEGFYGVYKDGNSCSEVVYDKNQSGGAKFWKSDGTSHKKFDYNEAENSKFETNNFEKALENLKGKVPDQYHEVIKCVTRTCSRDNLDERLAFLHLNSKEIKAVHDALDAKEPMKTSDVKPRHVQYMDFSGMGALLGAFGGQMACMAIGANPYMLPIALTTGFAGYKLGKVISHKLRVGERRV